MPVRSWPLFYLFRSRIVAAADDDDVTTVATSMCVVTLAVVLQTMKWNDA